MKVRGNMHVAGYTLILLIEMNIAFRYGLEYWKTACLTVNSGLEGGLTKGTDYGEVSKAVNSMIDDVIPPDINKSQMKFVAKDNKVLYALKPIMGLDINTLDAILENRPFDSVEDFYHRMVETKLTSVKKLITLVKSGAFDNVENNIDRKQIMAKVVKLEVPEKDKLTMTQLPYVKHLLSKDYPNLIKLYDFRNRIQGRNKESMNKDIESTFIKEYSKHVPYEFVDNELVIDIKEFNKYYNKEIKPIKEEIKKDKYLREFTKQKRLEFYFSECSGTVAEWEIETVLFNKDKFVIDTQQVNQTYELSNFDDLQDLPLKSVNKRGFPEYELSCITGVVVENNTQKKLVSILTEHSGVVTIKMNKKNYAKYHEKLENDSSWFERGTKLICIGYKNGEAFQLRGNYIYKNPLIKINGNTQYQYQNKKG